MVKEEERCLCGPIVPLTCFYSGDNGDKTQRNVTQNDEKRRNEYFSTTLYIRALDSKMAWHDIVLKSAAECCMTQSAL